MKKLLAIFILLLSLSIYAGSGDGLQESECNIDNIKEAMHMAISAYDSDTIGKKFSERVKMLSEDAPGLMTLSIELILCSQTYPQSDFTSFREKKSARNLERYDEISDIIDKFHREQLANHRSASIIY